MFKRFFYVTVCLALFFFAAQNFSVKSMLPDSSASSVCIQKSWEQKISQARTLESLYELRYCLRAAQEVLLKKIGPRSWSKLCGQLDKKIVEQVEKDYPECLLYRSFYL